MATQTELEQRVRHLERQVAILSGIIVGIGDELYAAASPEDIKQRLRQATADLNELRSDTAFETDDR